MSPTITHKYPITSTALAGVMLAVLLVLAEASVRTTVIVDTDAEAARNWSGGLAHCQEYVMEEAVNGVGIPGELGKTVLEMCCRQLREMMEADGSSSGNYCMGIEEAMVHMMEHELQQQSVRDEDKRNAWLIAEELPGKCDASLSRCRFNRRRSVAWF